MKRLLFSLCILLTAAPTLRAAAQTSGAPTEATAPGSAYGAAYESRQVEYERDFGKLHGTLTVPAGGAQTALLLIAGSGPTDRDGNNRLGIRSDCYRLLAE